MNRIFIVTLSIAAFAASAAAQTGSSVLFPSKSYQPLPEETTPIKTRQSDPWREEVPALTDYDAGRQYSPNDRCFTQCNASRERCNKQQHSQRSCNTTLKRSERDCFDIANPARRNNCHAQVIDCATPSIFSSTCENESANCLQACASGNGRMR